MAKRMGLLKLKEWYEKMLELAKLRGIVVDYQDMQEEYKVRKAWPFQRRALTTASFEQHRTLNLLMTSQCSLVITGLPRLQRRKGSKGARKMCALRARNTVTEPCLLPLLP